MKLFAGLGNPGAKYARNRHNVGFAVVDEIARVNGFGAWRQRFLGFASEGRIAGVKVLLLKPATFMNDSGQAVGEAVRYFDIELEDVIVFHDELDLAPGKVRVKTGGGAAGHNGLRSITQHIGNDYQRVRIGIGHPGHKDRVYGYVLTDFSKADHDWLDPLVGAMGSAADHLARGDGGRFMNAIAVACGDEPKAANGKPRAGPRSVEASDKKPGEQKPADGKPGERKLGKWDFAEKAARGEGGAFSDKLKGFWKGRGDRTDGGD